MAGDIWLYRTKWQVLLEELYVRRRFSLVLRKLKVQANSASTNYQARLEFYDEALLLSVVTFALLVLNFSWLHLCHPCPNGHRRTILDYHWLESLVGLGFSLVGQFPNTFLSRSLVRAMGSWRILASSWAIRAKRPSMAFWVM